MRAPAEARFPQTLIPGRCGGEQRAGAVVCGHLLQPGALVDLRQKRSPVRRLPRFPTASKEQNLVSVLLYNQQKNESHLAALIGFLRPYVEVHEESCSAETSR